MYHLQGKTEYLRIFHEAGFEVHGTVHTDGLSEDDLKAIPSFVTNHGLLKAEEFHELLLRAKVHVIYNICCRLQKHIFCIVMCHQSVRLSVK